MKKTTISIIVALIATLLPGSGLQAQTATPASGGNASGTGGSASYTVGLVFYNTNKGITGSVTEGVQQPFEISVVTGIEQAKGINLNCSAYPNPTTDYVILKVENMELSKLIFQLFDINGKLLENQKISGSESTISLRNFVPSTYFLKVIQVDHTSYQDVKTFKIIKN